MLKGNLKYLECFGPYLCEGMYEKKESDLSNYIQHLKNFNEQLLKYPDEERYNFLSGLKSTLTIVINHPNKFDLNNWYNDHFFHYLKDDAEVVKLLALIGNFFFPGNTFENDAFKGKEFIMEDSEIDF